MPSLRRGVHLKVSLGLRKVALAASFVLIAWLCLVWINSRHHRRHYRGQVWSPSGRLVAAYAEDEWRSSRYYSVAIGVPRDGGQLEWFELFGWGEFTPIEINWVTDAELQLRGRVARREGVPLHQFVKSLGVTVRVDPIE